MFLRPILCSSAANSLPLFQRTGCAVRQLTHPGQSPLRFYTTQQPDDPSDKIVQEVDALRVKVDKWLRAKDLSPRQANAVLGCLNRIEAFVEDAQLSSNSIYRANGQMDIHPVISKTIEKECGAIPYWQIP